ncbi:MAG TPA: hypothetical protein VNG90_02650 [Candidatus Acidoferrum sp.]|nr:hypothetical protein [Candidatus Acidoferrum sp.]
MSGIVSLIFGFLELVVGLRFVFRLFGADPGVQFVGWVYNISQPLITPFTGILGNPAIVPGAGHGVFEPSTLVALAVYAAVGGVLLQLFSRH